MLRIAVDPESGKEARTLEDNWVSRGTPAGCRGGSPRRWTHGSLGVAARAIPRRRSCEENLRGKPLKKKTKVSAISPLTKAPREDPAGGSERAQACALGWVKVQSAVCDAPLSQELVSVLELR